VDIDYTHHLYLNPLNGYIATYCANSIKDKYFFENPISLLVAWRDKKDFAELVGQGEEATLGLPSTALILRNGTTISAEAKYISDTWHNEMSRKMVDLERIFTRKTIRTWDESLAK
jgi:hypothetical protein